MPPKGYLYIRIDDEEQAEGRKILDGLCRAIGPAVSESSLARACYRIGLDAVRKNPKLILRHGGSSRTNRANRLR